VVLNNQLHPYPPIFYSCRRTSDARIRQRAEAQPQAAAPITAYFRNREPVNMPFPKSTVFAVIAAAASLSVGEAFAPASQIRSTHSSSVSFLPNDHDHSDGWIGHLDVLRMMARHISFYADFVLGLLLLSSTKSCQYVHRTKTRLWVNPALTKGCHPRSPSWSSYQNTHWHGHMENNRTMWVEVDAPQAAVHRAMMESWGSWRETLENTSVSDSAVHRVPHST
jgi:hypothetical protein